MTLYREIRHNAQRQRVKGVGRRENRENRARGGLPGAQSQIAWWLSAGKAEEGGGGGKWWRRGNRGRNKEEVYRRCFIWKGIRVRHTEGKGGGGGRNGGVSRRKKLF